MPLHNEPCQETTSISHAEHQCRKLSSMAQPGGHIGESAIGTLSQAKVVAAVQAPLRVHPLEFAGTSVKEKLAERTEATQRRAPQLNTAGLSQSPCLQATQALIGAYRSYVPM